MNNSAEGTDMMFGYPPSRKNSLNFGLLTGAALIVMSLIIYLLDARGTTVGDNIGFVVLIGGIAYGTWYYKMKISHGYISYGKGFSTGFMISLWSGIILAVFSYILFKFIDPSVLDQMRVIAEERSLSRNPDMTESEYEMTMKFIDWTMSPGILAFGAVLANTITGAIISLITAAIFQKEAKPNP